jgi:hypothetical protein
MYGVNQIYKCSENKLISVKEARKIIGKEALSIPDCNIEELILVLDEIATEYLNIVPSAKILRVMSNEKGSK